MNQGTIIASTSVQNGCQLIAGKRRFIGPEPMIEFKGLYCLHRKEDKKSVLVQFDGVLLHVWHQSEPFYRLFSSDVFRLPWSLLKGRRCIKLPNGGTIETDDQDALIRLRNKCLSLLNSPVASHPRQQRFLYLSAIALVILSVWSALYFKHLL